VGESPPFCLAVKAEYGYMDVVQKVTQAIEPSLEAMGYALVQIKLDGGAGRKTLTVMTERKDDKPMGVEDCSQVSRQVSALLDVEDPISSAYDLEVCSPGIDRPLVKLADFIRYKGSEIKLETYAPINPVDNRRRFRGTVSGVNGETVRLHVDEDEVDIAFSNIRNARLMISETLLKRKK
jgi:ribosome maturation factor RimP